MNLHIRFNNSIRHLVFSVSVVLILVIQSFCLQGAATAVEESSLWSSGMFTVNRCSHSFQQHCRWVAIELPFYPDSQCSRITYRGIDFKEILAAYGEPFQITLDEASPKPNHKTYGWGIPTAFANLNHEWNINAHWRYYNTCRF